MASVGIISNYLEIPRNVIKIDSRAHHENFKYEWRGLVKYFDSAIDDVFESDNIEEALKSSNDLAYRTAELVHFYSPLVTVRTSAFGTTANTYTHFMKHLSNEIFTRERISFLGNDINYSLKLAELIYTEDSIIRFFPELIIRPKDVHEREIRLIGSPNEILDWIFGCEKWYYLYLKRRRNKNELRKAFDDLYDGKNDAIKTAIKIKMFLPISPKSILSDDKKNLYNMITRDWMRNKKVDPLHILNYLYLNELDNLSDIGIILND